jgi:glucosamine-6-phosphate deaminase
MMEHAPLVEVLDTAEAVAERASAVVAQTLRTTGVTTLGLATGATMLPLYALLVEATRVQKISFRNAFSFNLDEYVGISRDDPGSFHCYMQQHLFGHIDIAPGRTHIPDGCARDIAAEARRYEALISAAGGIELQLLGIGANGHIGYNEPGSALTSRTRVVELDEATRRANAGGFPGRAMAPERAITMGIGTILEARHILLVATGAEKAAAIAAAIEGPLTTACPASALRLHRQVHVMCDRAAAAGLEGRPDNDNHARPDDGRQRREGSS